MVTKSFLSLEFALKTVYLKINNPHFNSLELSCTANINKFVHSIPKQKITLINIFSYFSNKLTSEFHSKCITLNVYVL